MCNMINIINMIKLNNMITHYSVLNMNGVKRVNPECSHHKENRSFSFPISLVVSI